jgi:hypothetical protein
MESIKFIKDLEKAVNSIKQVERETNSNYSDMEVFLKPDIKKFLIDNKSDLRKLFELRISKDLISFISFYVWKEKDNNGKSRFDR